MKIQLLAVIALTAMLVSGCGTTGSKLSPALVTQGVATGVSYSVQKFPTARPYITAASAVVCSAANSTNISPAQVVAAIEASGSTQFKTAEGVLILNTALLLYTGVWESYGVDVLNNYPELVVYLQATCAGMEQGLGAGPLRAPGFKAGWPLISWP